MQYDNNNNNETTMTTTTVSKQSLDRCRWHCPCPNGILATVLVNALLWAALVCSGGALVDCHLVQADIMGNNNVGTTWPALPSNLIGLTDGQPTDRRGFGFFVHEDANGECRWEYWGDQWDDSEDWTSEDEKEFEDYIEDYFDWMGKDWRRAARVGCAAAIMGFVIAVSATLYACLSHVRVLRYITGALAILVIMPLQFAVLSVRDSDFCKERDCQLDRSGHLAIVAGILYLVAGAIFFFMKNYSDTLPEESMLNETNEQKHAKTLELEEATHPDDACTAGHAIDYAIDASPMDNGDGIEEAREVKAQLY